MIPRWTRTSLVCDNMMWRKAREGETTFQGEIRVPLPCRDYVALLEKELVILTGDPNYISVIKQSEGIIS